MDKTVLAYIDINDKYLLLYRNKEKGDINQGKWLGVGGHLEEGETPDQALIREIKEETNLDVVKYQYRALLYFNCDDYSEIMYLYTVSEVKGEIGECDEGDLKFFDKKEIFDLPMWEADKLFLKKLLNNDPYFEMELNYSGNKLISVKYLK